MADMPAAANQTRPQFMLTIRTDGYGGIQVEATPAEEAEEVWQAWIKGGRSDSTLDEATDVLEGEGASEP